MLIGYVSDERYVALPAVLLEMETDGHSIEVTSRATGAVYADVAPGPAKVTLYKDGYGQKSVEMTVSHERPYHFRLLKDGLLAYMWPSGSRLAKRPSFASTLWRSIRWSCGVMG